MTTTEPLSSGISNDAFLWYNVGSWGPAGLAVPNWGNDPHSTNSPICRLVRIFGRSLQLVMFHGDAMLYRPPTLNTAIRIHELCTRARSILAGRSVPENEKLLETTHAIPASEEHVLYPVPYFTVRNEWLKEYCQLGLITLTEMLQHSDNQRTLELTDAFTKKVSAFVQRIYMRLGMELFNIPKERASALDFTLTQADFNAYAPSKLISESEMIDPLVPPTNVYSEDELAPLTRGIPVSQLPRMGRWPNGSGTPNSQTTENGTTAQNVAFKV